MKVLSFFLSSKIGRWLIIFGLILLIVLAIVARIFAAGKAAAKTTILKNTLNLALERIKHDQDIGRLSADELRKRLRQRYSTED